MIAGLGMLARLGGSHGAGYPFVTLRHTDCNTFSVTATLPGFPPMPDNEPADLDDQVLSAAIKRVRLRGHQPGHPQAGGAGSRGAVRAGHRPVVVDHRAAGGGRRPPDRRPGRGLAVATTSSPGAGSSTERQERAARSGGAPVGAGVLDRVDPRTSGAGSPCRQPHRPLREPGSRPAHRQVPGLPADGGGVRVPACSPPRCWWPAGSRTSRRPRCGPRSTRSRTWWPCEPCTPPTRSPRPSARVVAGGVVGGVAVGLALP